MDPIARELHMHGKGVMDAAAENPPDWDRIGRHAKAICTALGKKAKLDAAKAHVLEAK